MGGLISRYIYGKKDDEYDEYNEILKITEKLETDKMAVRMLDDIIIVFKREEKALTKMTFNKRGELINKKCILLPRTT